MSGTRRRTPIRGAARTLVGGLACFGVIAATLAATGSGAQAAPDPADDTAKIKPKLAAQLEAKGEAAFWVRFDDKADLSRASKISDWNERGQFVYDALRATASESQRDIRAQLDDQGVEYKAFWATNAVRVQAGSAELAQELAAAPEVEALYPTRDYSLEKPIKGENVHEVNAVEWGIANINADDV